jgi:hypothetical protein
MACLASFLEVSPLRETQDLMVDARLDFLYRDAGAMEKLDEVEDEACKALHEVNSLSAQDAQRLAWYTKYPPKNDEAATAVEASAPPPRTPDRPAAAADEPRPKRGMALSDDEGPLRAKQTSYCGLNGHCSLADLDPGRRKWEGGFLARSMLCNTLCIMLHSIIYNML